MKPTRSDSVVLDLASATKASGVSRVDTRFPAQSTTDRLHNANQAENRRVSAYLIEQLGRFRGEERRLSDLMFSPEFSTITRPQRREVERRYRFFREEADRIEGKLNAHVRGMKWDSETQAWTIEQTTCRLTARVLHAPYDVGAGREVGELSSGSGSGSEGTPLGEVLLLSGR